MRSSGMMTGVASTLAAVGRRDRIFIVVAFALAIMTGIAVALAMPSPVVFVLAGVSLAGMAAVIGRSVDGLAQRLSPNVTGIIQATLGNLPELFVTIFALQAGLFTVVQATIVGSVLANVLLVLGAAFIVGGLRHGLVRFSASGAQAIGIMLLLSVTVLSLPTIASLLHTPAAGHERELSVFVAIVMIIVFALSIFAQLRGTPLGPEHHDASAALRSAETEAAVAETPGHGAWPFAFAIGLLAVTGLMSAFVSDWFVGALTPTMDSLGISQAFAGLVIVAIAGNAVENVVGIQLAAKGKADYAMQIILQSPLQVAMFVAPVLILAAPLVGAASFALVFPPMLLVALIAAVVIALFVVFDGTSNWVEGVILVGLYAIIASIFWWG